MNGVEIHSQSDSISTIFTPTHLNLGCITGFDSFCGRNVDIDDLRIYNRALT